jgi:hypothetical protein
LRAARPMPAGHAVVAARIQAPFEEGKGYIEAAAAAAGTMVVVAAADTMVVDSQNSDKMAEPAAGTKAARLDMVQRLDTMVADSQYLVAAADTM